MDRYITLIDKLKKERALSAKEWAVLIKNRSPKLSEYLFSLAREEQERCYGKDIFLRGLIEFSNYCKNDCLYCGIRRSNRAARRYLLTRTLSFPVVTKDTALDSVPSSSRAAKTPRSPRQGLQILSEGFARTSRTAPSHFLQASGARQATGHFLTREPTDIFCAMKPAMTATIPCSTPRH